MQEQLPRAQRNAEETILIISSVYFRVAQASLSTQGFTFTSVVKIIIHYLHIRLTTPPGTPFLISN
jgi:hypothetical protein